MQDKAQNKRNGVPWANQPFLPYMLISASLSIGYGSVFTLLAEFRKQFGFDETQLGLIAASGFFAGFVAQVGLARFADRGFTRQLVWFGLVAVLASMVFMVVADQYWQFLTARLLFGLGSGSIVPAFRRIIITRDPEGVGENLGRMTAFDVSGFVLGPAMAAALSELAGIRLPFIVLFFMYIGSGVAISRLDLESPAEPARPAPVRELLAIPAIVSGLLVAIAIYTTIGAFEATWSLLLTDLGASTLLIGGSLSAFTIPMIIFAPTGGRAAQERGAMTVVRFTIPVAMVCMLVYAWVDSLWPVLLASLVHALADAWSFPAAQVHIARNSPSELIATAQGLFSSSGTLTSGIVAAAAGWLYNTQGPGVLFSGAVAVMAVSLGAALAIHATTSTRDRAASATKV